MTDTPGDAALRRVVVEMRNARDSRFDAPTLERWIKEWIAALEANTRHTPEGGGQPAPMTPEERAFFEAALEWGAWYERNFTMADWSEEECNMLAAYKALARPKAAQGERR